MACTIVIPSRRRPYTVKVAGKMFPDALWCVAESEAPEYALPPERLLIHPDSLEGKGLSAKRQWINDTVPGTVFQVDDDVFALFCMVGHEGVKGRRFYDPETIRAVIENAAHVAEEIGAPVFGFNQAWDVRKFRAYDPFHVSGWIGTAIGFTEAARAFKYDPALKSQCDIDFCLRVLLKGRYLWVDERFSFICKRFTNIGGSAGVRSSGEYEGNMLAVKRRWGRWMSVRKAKTTMRAMIHVPRRQSLDFGDS